MFVIWISMWKGWKEDKIILILMIQLINHSILVSKETTLGCNLCLIFFSLASCGVIICMQDDYEDYMFEWGGLYILLHTSAWEYLEGNLAYQNKLTGLGKTENIYENKGSFEILRAYISSLAQTWIKISKSIQCLITFPKCLASVIGIE